MGSEDEPQLGVYHEGRIVNESGNDLGPIRNDMPVRLWHPIDAEVDTILRWRRWLQQHQVAQPFKQAHRELYTLTDVERRTATYSNRYASHILKQAQFRALCRVRGWKSMLQARYEDEPSPAWCDVPAWGPRAQYWIEAIDDGNSPEPYPHLSTDQVRFYPIGAVGIDDPLPLDDVPAVVFSETMRDIGLFVGVAGVGNDPTWFDGGPDGLHRNYWLRASVGELTETAQTRYELLKDLLPRLKISDRCELSDRFLIVRGDLRTYKIHLGSGNVLMEPDNRYLCIVATRTGERRANQLFIPFEGDTRLSEILSKASLLAGDAKIKDESIRRQIERL